MSRNRRNRPPVANNNENGAHGDDQNLFDEKAAYLSVRNLLSLCTSIQAEAEATDAAQHSIKFVRSFENATCDGGILVYDDDFAGLPANATDRWYNLVENLGDSPRRTIIPLDVKCMSWSAESMTREQIVYKYLRSKVQLEASQVSQCQALILVNMMDPDMVAFLPRSYMRFIQAAADKRNKITLVFDLTERALGPASPFPPSISHLVMRKEDLPQMLDDFAEKVVNPNKVLINPYTGYPLARQTVAELSLFSFIIPDDAAEFRVRRRIWQILTATASSGLTFTNPTHAPLTSDIRLDHGTGHDLVQVFVEIKCSMVRVQQLPNGQSKFSHCQNMYVNAKKRSIFYHNAPWDWLLTMSNDNNGYLILKDDIPMDMWHRSPDEGDNGWIHHEVPPTFLRNREVDLSRPDAQVCANLCRILKGDGKLTVDPPRHAMLTSDDILHHVGPGGSQVMEFPRGDNADFHMDENSEDEDGQDDEASEGEEEEDDDENDEGQEGWARTLFMTDVQGGRTKARGGLELKRYTQIIEYLQKECRVKGQGCVLDLGMYNPMGTIGFVRHTWSEADKVNYDNTGLPPCWLGRLSNFVPMVTLVVQYSRWRSSYAPVEGTRLDIEAYLDAAPCLVAVTAQGNEVGHMQSERWLIPSEFMPQVHLGGLGDEPQRRASLILPGRQCLEEFAVQNHDLHGVLSQFVSGVPRIHIGYGRVAVEAAPYLKTIGDFKQSCDVNFDRCIAGPIRWSDTTT